MRKTKKKFSLSSFIIHNSLFIILFLFVGVNISFAASPLVALYKWLKVAEFVSLGWYIVCTKPKLSAVGVYLSVGVWYSSVLAIAQFILQRSVGGPLWFLGERTFDIATPGIARWEGFERLTLRPYATFPHPNVFGGFLAVVLPLVMFTNMNRFMKWTTVALGAVALVLTFSRSAWVVGAGAAVLTIARMRKGKILILFLILYSLLMIHVARTVHLTDESFVRRSQLNRAAIAMWQRSPLFGVGLGNFIVELPKHTQIRYGNFLQPVHNIYLLVLSEMGLVGVSILTLLIVFLVKRELRSMNYGKFILHYSLFIILLLGLVDHYPITLQQGQLLLSLFLGFLIQ